jgi:Tol biopolymer transport system component
MPDGKSVFFVKDPQKPDEPTKGFALSVSDGRANGEPRLIARNLGPVSSRPSMSEQGTLSFTHLENGGEVYVLSTDLTGAGSWGTPTRISRETIGDHVAPSWSPDGGSIAYFTTRPQPFGYVPLKTLTIKDLSSGTARQVPVSLDYLGGYSPQWLPDGQRLVVWGRSEEQWGYYQVDLRTQHVSPVMTVGNRNARAYSAIARDGRFLYTDPARGIVSLNLDGTRQDTVVVASGARSDIGRFMLSPDLQSIAFVANAGTQLKLQSADRSVRTLVTATSAEPINLQAWVPDGTAVLYTRPSVGRAPKLWRVSASGEPSQVDLHFEVVGNLTNPVSFSPDGRRMAYTERVTRRELWMIERLTSTLTQGPAQILPLPSPQAR